MHVKELTIQGFKSFATKHRFVFPAGITAVVGPNGSGKSNIADSVRWILGEQRATSLRARRIDEMIFAGTERRSRAGLAEVSVTFDNAARWLDIDFSEVVISRRAHRDGTTTFAINGAPVRMREVQDLLGGRLGQGNYTVIGQGLVDGALTLRPEDRRVLIDEAAGLVPIQRKRDHSLRQLAETHENLTRVEDIIAEIGPRLKRMARLASQAERYQEVSAELGAQLLTWYGYHWHRAIQQLALARAATLGERGGVVAAQAEIDAAEAGLREVEELGDREDEVLAEWRAARQALGLTEAQARQAAAVAEARLDALDARRGEMVAAEQGAGADLDRLREGIAVRRADLAAIGSRHAAAASAHDAARAALAAAEAERDARSRGLEQLRAELFALAADQSAARKRLAGIADSRSDRQVEREAALAAGAALQVEAGSLAAEREEAAARLAQAGAALAAVVAELAGADGELAGTVGALGAARDAYAEARGTREALRARSDALDAWFGEADESGQILARLRELGDLAVVGTVAELIEVDERWEAAVAAALGLQVHGVVVRDLGDALRALALVQAEPQGTVTLVALSSPALVRPRWSTQPGEQSGLEVSGAPAAPGLVEALLGDVAFVEDLDAAIAALGTGRDGEGLPMRSATRDGLLVLRGGVIAGGTPGKAVLELQRERRALPAAVETAAAAEVAAAAAEIDRLVAQRQQVEGRLADLTDARSAVVAARDRASAADEQARTRVERAAREQEWAAENVQRLDAALEALDRETALLGAEVDAAAPRESALREAMTTAAAALEATDLSPLRVAVAAAAAELAELAQALAGARAGLQAAEADLRATEERLVRDQTRAQSLDTERRNLEAESVELRRRIEQLGVDLAALDVRIGPAEARLREARLDARHRAAARDALRRRLAEAEARLSEARIAETRAEDRLERLRDQLGSDAEWLPQLEVPAAGPGDAASSDPPDEADDPLGQILPEVDELPAEFEARLAGLRRQMRAIGPIDQETLDAYQETADRFALLNGEQADLHAAERDLRSLLEVLEAEMAQRFDATYAAVAESFAGFFPQLFGGGEAELVLQRDPESGGQAGLDILARPPGKRRQPLALLSGGERTLTAVALIFALLEVSQTPFVVLDEVDAALDEANVSRFCAALESLATRRQVVIITHNRGTIQTASTIYGVTMGDDGASQIISLEVEAAAAATA